MKSKVFFEALFQDDVSKDAQLSIFTLPNRQVARFASIAEATKYIGKDTAEQNVYFGLGLIAGDPKGRGKLKDIVGIPGLWADIDIAGGDHKKKNLPENHDAAWHVVEKFPLKPSIVISSGGGLHVYWLFKEVWMFDDYVERKTATVLSARFGETLKIMAAGLGYQIDTVSDLTRVLRVAGTFNQKNDPPIEVTTITGDGALATRYTPDDFEDYLVAASTVKKKTTRVVDGVNLSATAEPPADKMFAMLENDPKFKQSWNQTRTDLPDASPSSYDASLATIAVIAGWGDQEIANLIIASRRKHNQDINKALRWDYIKRTITMARTSQQQDADDVQDKIETKQREQEVREAANEAEKIITGDQEVDPVKRKFFLTCVSTTLGIKIVRWLQHGEENARYSLQLENGNWVRMGTAQDVLSGRVFRSRLYEATRFLIKNLKAKVWDDVCKNLAAAAEVIENEEVTSSYRAGQWVASYLQDHPVWVGDWREGAYICEPLEREGKLLIHAGELRKHMKMVQGERQISHVELCDSLRVAGYIRTSISAYRKGTSFSRSYWACAGKLTAEPEVANTTGEVV